MVNGEIGDFAVSSDQIGGLAMHVDNRQILFSLLHVQNVPLSILPLKLLTLNGYMRHRNLGILASGGSLY